MRMRIYISLLAVSASFLLISGLLGYRLNTTTSMPVGIYRIAENKTLHRGDTVIFCLESEEFIRLAVSRNYLGDGQCPGGIPPLLKKVVALPGDSIALDNDKILVNDSIIAGSQRKKKDSHGRKMPTVLKAGVIPKGKALMLSNYNQMSFDSRYFGLVALDKVQLVTPVVTF